MERVYCSFCEQTYTTSSLSKCSLCGKSGGLAPASQPDPGPTENAAPDIQAPETKAVDSVSVPLDVPAREEAPWHPAQPPSWVQQLGLGPAVVFCRRVSGAQELRSQGFVFGWLLHYVLGPFMMMPYIALATTTVVLFIFGYTFDDMPVPLFLGLWAILFCVCIWLYYIRPRSEYMVLCEDGFAIRVGFRRLRVRREELQGVYIGRKPRVVEKALRAFVTVVKPAQGRWLASLDDTALTISIKGLKPRVLPAILTKFDRRDLEVFSQELVKRCPFLEDQVSPPNQEPEANEDIHSKL